MDDAMAQASGNDAAARIIAAVTAHADARGYRIGEGAEFFFRERAEDAARQIGDDAVAMERAILNGRALIDAMIAARPDAYAGDDDRLASDIIGEATLGAALAKLCPIWPFC